MKMACRYFLGDRELSRDELTSFMKNLPHEHKLKLAPEIAKDSYQRLSWTPGEAQAARYDLSKQISQITYNAPGSKMADKYGTVLKAFDHNGHEVINKSVKPEELPDVIGKEAADRLLKSQKKNDKHELSGLDLKVGGEGMKGFYDQIIPKAAERIGKEHGVKVKQTTIGIPHKAGVQGQRLNVHYIDIPQSLKDTATKRGFPLFSSGVMFVPVDHDPWEKK